MTLKIAVLNFPDDSLACAQAICMGQIDEGLQELLCIVHLSYCGLLFYLTTSLV